MRIRLLAVLGAAVLSLTACSSTIAGTGTPGSGVGAPGATGFPSSAGSSPSSVPSGSASPGTGATPSGSGSSGTTPQGFTCPTITDPDAQLSYPCITTGMTYTTDDPSLPRSVVKQTEPGWVISEGAAQLADPATQTELPATAAAVVQQLVVGDQGYGTDPATATLAAAATTVSGKPAYLLQTQITLNATFRSTAKLKVSVERLYVLVVQLSTQRQAVWLVSIPNTQSTLWPTVPSAIAKIKVT